MPNDDDDDDDAVNTVKNLWVPYKDRNSRNE